LALDKENLFSQSGFKKQAESSYIAQALRQLESKGVIQKLGSGKYQFSNLFFRDYILTLTNATYFENDMALALQINQLQPHNFKAHTQTL
jgi:hypothetical protein